MAAVRATPPPPCRRRRDDNARGELDVPVRGDGALFEAAHHDALQSNSMCDRRQIGRPLDRTAADVARWPDSDDGAADTFSCLAAIQAGMGRDRCIGRRYQAVPACRYRAHRPGAAVTRHDRDAAAIGARAPLAEPPADSRQGVTSRGTSSATCSAAGTSGSGVRATSTEARRPHVPGERLAERVVEPVDRLRGTPNARGHRLEVGRVQIDAVGLLARDVLVVAEHPVAAVVDDHRRQRDLLLRHRRQLAAREQEAAVAGDRDRRPACPRAPRRAPPGTRSRASPSRAAPAAAAARRACGTRRASSRGCTCRTTTMPSAGTAKRIASRKRSAVASSVARSASRARAGARASSPLALAHAAASAATTSPRRLEHHVDAVVRRRARGDGDQRRRLRLGEVLRLHAVEVRADRDHHVRLVPQPAAASHVRRHPDAGTGGPAAARPRAP